MEEDSPRYPPMTPELVVRAYAMGCFPMADSRSGEVAWYSPDPRAVLPLDRFHVPHGLRRALKRDPYHVTLDTAFERVIRACALPRSYQRETWINDPIIDVYSRLHEMGIAHSVEAWRRDPQTHRPTDELVGGLYGLAIGGAFFGESMFSTASDASKICLVRLVEHLRQRGYALCDAQLENDHLKQFGIEIIPREEYLARLNVALRLNVNWIG